MSEFFVGQKVVCVDDASHPEWPFNAGKRANMCGLTNGTVYTVHALDLCHDNKSLAVHLCEIPARRDPFAASRFRPLESKSIQLFRDIAQGVTDGKPIIPDDQPIRVPTPVGGWTVESLTADIQRRAGEC